MCQSRGWQISKLLIGGEQITYVLSNRNFCIIVLRTPELLTDVCCIILTPINSRVVVVVS